MICKMTFRDSKRKLTISYPCVMLNVDVARNNTNDQYQVIIETVLQEILSFTFKYPLDRVDFTLPMNFM